VAGRSEELCAQLEELARLTVLDEGDPQSFRARAYEQAANELRGVPGDVASMSEAELVRLEGVGRSTARRIREYFEAGRIARLEELRAKYPPEVLRLARLPGVGPKTLARLRTELGIESVEDLRRAIEAQAIRGLRGLGARTEARLARALVRLGPEVDERRLPIADAMPVARRLVAELASLPGVEHAECCGSLRRLRESIGDLDLLVASREPSAVAERIAALPALRGSAPSGTTRFSLEAYGGLQVDVRIVAPEQVGAALLYFTGSKAHNIRLRQLALRRGFSLSEYALAESESGRVIASRTEQEIYAALGLAPIPPPMREDTGEIEAAASGSLPAPLAVADLRGDLHVHTDLSGDGRSSLEQVLGAARTRGYAYLAITDHAEDLPRIGAGRDRLLEQRARLRGLEAAYPGMRLLHGVELNIGRDGGLDYDAAFRASFDWCVAGVHSHFDLDRDAQTRRILAAMRDPAVGAIAHLSGRMLGRRPGIELDVDAILRGAAATGTAIEINAALERLDAAWEVLRKARGQGVRFVVSTDAHHTDDLDRMQWGARQAQRGWVDPDQVANTWPRERFLAWTRARRRR
jgi:DNA polymerase (family 10)